MIIKSNVKVVCSKEQITFCYRMFFMKFDLLQVRVILYNRFHP